MSSCALLGGSQWAAWLSGQSEKGAGVGKPTPKLQWRHTEAKESNGGRKQADRENCT